MANIETLFAGLHILMRDILDGPEDAGRRLRRYWYRERRCQVRIGWQKLCDLCGYKSVKICVNPWLMKYSSCLCVFVATNPLNQRNPCLTNDLRLRKITYEIISLFLQNEPNFRKSQMNLSIYEIMDYKEIDTWWNEKNEPKTNPIYRGAASGEAGTKPISEAKKYSYERNFLFDIYT